MSDTTIVPYFWSIPSLFFMASIAVEELCCLLYQSSGELLVQLPSGLMAVWTLTMQEKIYLKKRVKRVEARISPVWLVPIRVKLTFQECSAFVWSQKKHYVSSREFPLTVPFQPCFSWPECHSNRVQNVYLKQYSVCLTALLSTDRCTIGI